MESSNAGRRGRRRGRVLRIFKGYLMVAGALATLYLLVQLAVVLLVEVGKWQSLM